MEEIVLDWAGKREGRGRVLRIRFEGKSGMSMEVCDRNGVDGQWREKGFKEWAWSEECDKQGRSVIDKDGVAW